MSFERADAIVRAVLYEGYVLYPYRASSLKNRQRFTFGCVHARAAEPEGEGGDPCRMKTECLVVGGEGALALVAVRFLQVIERVDQPSCPVWHEAVERTVPVPERTVGALAREGEIVRFAFDAEHREVDGVLRRSAAIAGLVEVRAAPVASGAHRVAVEIRNLTPAEAGRRPGGPDRQAARDTDLLSTFASTHTLVGVRGGELVSLVDPPEALREAAAACENVGTWPILVGDPASRDLMLSSPIILEDHPRIAPESPEALYDCTEIDEILTLRILTLTDAEKAEVRATDPRARALLDRVEALGPEAICRLHGTARRPDQVDLRPGDRVRLRPEGRADVLDLALAGMDATVTGVERDYEGRVHFAVTVDDDPGRDLGASGQPGHRFFFRREELERR
jgi:hypothetical protein